MSFTSDITEFVEKTKIKADLVVRKLALEGLRGCIFMSPVDTGRFRGSWRVGINVVDTSTHPEIIKPDPMKPHPSPLAADVATGTNTILKVKFGQDVYITNNVPYAQALEDGHSKQAPAGVLAVTFERIVTGFAATVESVKNGN